MASLLRRIERGARATKRRAARATRRGARRTERAAEARPRRRTVRHHKTGLEALLAPTPTTRHRRTTRGYARRGTGLALLGNPVRRTRRVRHKAEAPIVKLLGGGKRRR